VDVLDQEVGGAGHHEGVVGGGLPPLEELSDEARDLVSTRAGVDHLVVRVDDVHLDGAKRPGLGDEARGEQPVRDEEVIDTPRV
jgi:hypothetical protein